MTDTAKTSDPTMAAIANAVGRGRDGDRESARRDLLAIWRRIGVAGDPFHRCTLAHYLADLYEDAAEALIWDIRALDAADTITDERAQRHHASLNVAGFYPSLYLNIADNLRQLGTFEAASKYINLAESHISALSSDVYGNTIRAAISEIGNAIRNCDTARRASSPGTSR